VREAELGADGVLLVTFADGTMYAYANFTPALFEEWQKASSAGSWFHNNVRKKPEQHPVVGPKAE
jgi:KTSC domain